MALSQEFSVDVLHSRYELYGWCEQKVAHLLAVCGVLFGAAVVLVTHDGFRRNWETVDFVLAAIVGVFLGAGLIICLLHAVPKMNSKLGNESNPRVTIAIDQFGMEEYFQLVAGLEPEAALRFTTSQIKGMNRIIMRNQEAIRTASYVSIIGFVALVVLVTRSFI